MHIAKLLAMILGLAIAAIGTLGVVAPSALLEFGRSLQTTNALYVVAGVRVVFGAKEPSSRGHGLVWLLLLVSSSSMPSLLLASPRPNPEINW